MKTKSEITKEYILNIVAPIFNKKGYEATSISDITKATKLTKGAIYGNFENKEDLAIQVFKRNVKYIIKPLSEQLTITDNSIEKLFILTNYYREYYDIALKIGGCPVLNVASDTNNVNSKLFEAVKKIAKDLEYSLESFIKVGISNKEIKKDVNAKLVAKNIYSMIEGSVFMAFIHTDKTYISEMMNQIDRMIVQDLIN
jgi:AcrR family transcriptional regulator